MQIDASNYLPPEPEGEDSVHQDKSSKSSKSDNAEDFKKKISEKQQREQVEKKADTPLNQDEEELSPHELFSKKSFSKNVDQNVSSNKPPIQEEKKGDTEETQINASKPTLGTSSKEKQPSDLNDPLKDQEQENKQGTQKQQSIFDLAKTTRKPSESAQLRAQEGQLPNTSSSLPKKESESKGLTDSALKGDQKTQDGDKTSQLNASKASLDNVKEKEDEHRDKQDSSPQSQQSNVVQNVQQIEIKGAQTQANVQQTNAKDLSSLIEKMYVHVDKIGATSTFLTLKSVDGNVTEIQITQQQGELNIKINSSDSRLIAEVTAQQSSIVSALNGKQIKVHTLECNFQEKNESSQKNRRVEGTQGEPNT